jgi:hypothetical protein
MVNSFRRLDEIRKAIAGNSTKTSVGSEIEAETETIKS